MSNYIYFNHDQRRIFERYPQDPDIIGLNDWREYCGNPRELLNKLREYLSPEPKNSCPRLFISHRQVDDLYALRIAELASDNGFEYWVDVFDPSLRSLDGNPHYSKEEISILTACIIEMALINCSHVITAMTPNTRGSQWVPYEYGRIVEFPSIYDRACAWKHPGLLKTELPEYMDLGIIAFNEAEIQKWLSDEHLLWIRKRNEPCTVTKWGHKTQQPLPV